MANDLWRTPPEVINYIEKRFGTIQIDLCSSDENRVYDFNLTEEDNFLDDKWLFGELINKGSLAWCNPPYSNPLPFVKQCVKWSKCGYAVAMILNLDTSTKWFKEIVNNAAMVIQITGGRVAFLNDEGLAVKGNSKPQCIVYFAPFGRTSLVTEYVSLDEIMNYETA